MKLPLEELSYTRPDQTTDTHTMTSMKTYLLGYGISTAFFLFGFYKLFFTYTLIFVGADKLGALKLFDDKQSSESAKVEKPAMKKPKPEKSPETKRKLQRLKVHAGKYNVELSSMSAETALSFLESGRSKDKELEDIPGIKKFAGPLRAYGIEKPTQLVKAFKNIVEEYGDDGYTENRFYDFLNAIPLTDERGKFVSSCKKKPNLHRIVFLISEYARSQCTWYPEEEVRLAGIVEEDEDL